MEFLHHARFDGDALGAQAGHSLRIDAPHGDDLTLISFEGVEAVSAPFAFDVTVSAPHADDEIARSLLGADAALTLAPDREHPARTIHGVVEDVRVGLASPAGGLPRVRIRVVSRLALAAHRRDTRVFQDALVTDVISRTLRPYAVELAWRVEAPQAARGYCTQYEETDLDFVQRLLAEEGVAWYSESYENERGVAFERMVCVDVPTRWPEMEGGAALSIVYAEGMASRGEHLSRFEANERVGVGAVAMRGYDVTLPQRELDAVARDPRTLRYRDEAAAELYLHHDEGQESDVRRSRARHRLAQARREVERAEGQGTCARLRPGHYFALADHTDASLDRRWVPTRVTHRGRCHDVEGFAQNAEGPTYECAFQCVPAERPFAPPIPPRRILQVTETATVVGPPGEDIHVDGLGRVQVRFHWERRAANEAVSCWIPVTQSWAGGGWGTQFIPRVGMEVLVTFLGGDPDRPVILGCLPSSSAPPPFSLPEQRTRSGLRTHTSPEGVTGHELVFEDLAGQEFVSLSARGDLHLRAARHAELSAASDLTLRAAASASLEVGGSLQANVDGALRTTVLRARTSVTGGEHLSEVRGRRGDEIEGDWSASIGGGLHFGARGAVSLDAGDVLAPSSLTLHAEGDLDASASERITLTATTEIVLRCGDSAIVITPEGVEIRAPRVTVTGEHGVEAEGNGARFSLDAEEALVSARRVRMFSDGADLTLDRDAHVRGREVLLNCDDAPRPDAPQDPREPERMPLRLRVTDAALRPFVRRPFHVLAGGETLKGETDDDGWVRARPLADASAATITVWTGEYPRGARRTWTVSLDALAPAETTRGLKERLQNLGWYGGAIDDDDDDALTEALHEFQSDVGLTPSGEADAPTRAKILALHGV